MKKLLSRKFLIALGSVIALVAAGEYNHALAVVAAYLGVEGVIDHKAAGVTPEAPVSPTLNVVNGLIV